MNRKTPSRAARLSIAVAPLALVLAACGGGGGGGGSPAEAGTDTALVWGAGNWGQKDWAPDAATAPATATAPTTTSSPVITANTDQPESSR